VRALAFLLLVAACEREWVREYDGSLLNLARTGPVFLLRDYLTGKPVPGVTVRQHPEWDMGPDGRWAPLLAERSTDEFGLVVFTVPSDAGNRHWAVHAKGYAPTESYGVNVADEIELRPPRTFTGTVLAVDGRPLANALVGWKVGCAHAPTLAEARTDERGSFVLRGIDDGEFVLEEPGAARYVDAAEPSAPAPVDQVLPGLTLRGRVVGPGGVPPAWAVVCGTDRAPRAVADREGRFTLRGFPGGTVFVWWEEGLEEFRRTFAPGLEAVLVVGGAEEASEPVGVRVRVRDGNGARPPVALPLFLDDVADGRRYVSEWSPWGEDATAWVPPGTYRLSAGDAWSAYVSDPREGVVAEGAELDLLVRAQPTLEFDSTRLPDDAPARWRIVLEEESFEFNPDLEPPNLPLTARAWLRVDLGKTPYTFEIGPERSGVRRADVRLPGRKFILVPGLEEGLRWELCGDTAEVVEGLEPTDIQTRSNGLATYAVGKRQLVLSDAERGRAAVEVDLPIEAATLEPDCTLTPWPEPVELRVRLDDGTPVAGAKVTVLDGESFLDEPSETDEDGVLRRRFLRDGLHLKVERPGSVPTWAQLAGAPPYEVRLGTAAIEVDVAGLESASSVLDGLAIGAEDGVIALRGLAAGPHTLVLAAEGRRGIAYGLVLRVGETRRIVYR